jgi:uncharacterized protein DUF664
MWRPRDRMRRPGESHLFVRPDGSEADFTEETARHNGHADVIRELIDGTTGD